MKSKIRTKQRENRPSLFYRFCKDGLGILLLLSSLGMAVALWFYNPLDPSWNTAIDAEVLNPLGAPGAIFADGLLQGLGWAASLVVLFMARLGIFFLFGVKKLHLVRGIWYGTLVVICVTTWATTLEGLGNLLGSHAGGVLGAIICYEITAQLKEFYMAVPQGLLTLLLGGVGAISLYWGLAIPWDHWTTFFRWVKEGFGWIYRVVGCLGGKIFYRRLSSSQEEPHFGFSASPHLSKKIPGEQVVSGNKTPRERQEPSSGLEMRVGDRKNIPIEKEIFSRFDEDGLGKEETRGISKEGARSKGSPSLIELIGEVNYAMPSLDLLRSHEKSSQKIQRLSDAEIQERARELESVLEEFGVRGEINRVRPGPVVTLFELTPAPGIKSSRIVGLSDDIARSMSAVSARVAVIPGQNAIGIELPNEHRETVYLRTLLETDAFERTASRLALALGKDIGGAPVVVDLARMPHLLVAGTTGSGKSVAINTMILSLLFRLSPKQCKFIMIDPKMLELSVYEGIPHLLAPVVTEPKKAIVALKWVVREMEERYRLMARLGVRNIDGYNQRLSEAMATGEILTRRVQVGFDSETGMPQFEEQPLEKTVLPYIVVVVDEMADLMIVAGKDIESAIQRLAQMARAAGIHIIMATQRPSVDVITGTIKANFPTRISFQVTSKIDSRTILGEQGAEQLLGQGDMLYMAPGGRLSRVHGPFVQDDEVEKVVAYLKSQGTPSYIDDITREEDLDASDGKAQIDDPLYNQALALVMREQKASTSFIQRHLQIGYNRAARLVDLMEQEGVISAANHVGKREVFGR